MRLLSFVCVTLLFSAMLTAVEPSLEQYIVDRITLPDGTEIVGIIAPMAKPDYTMPVAVPTRATVILPNVPALDWAYGCSATSAAMYAGYLDRVGLDNVYAGPTTGGVFPLPTAGTNYWGFDVQGNYRCPLSATQIGIDGRIINGHVNNYWVSYGNSGNDPLLDGPWPSHVQGDCTGDYMGTNQDYWNSSDGSTTFYNNTGGSRLYDYTSAESNPPGTRRRDGVRGFRLFVESRGYEVYSNFNQYILGYSGNPSGFTFAEYTQEIDAGRPVLIQVDGHTMLGMGYDDATNTVYLHDTWDFSQHSMVWGTSYSGMAHYGVAVLVTENHAYASSPYVEDFEAGYPDADWRLWKHSDDYVSDVTASSAHYGTYGLELTTLVGFGFTSVGGTDLPSMWTKAQPGGANEDFTQFADLNVNLGALAAPELQFDYRLGYNSLAWYNNFWVMVEDSGGTWHQVYAEQPTSSVPWNTRSLSLTAYAGQNVRVRFFHNGYGPPHYCHIDNISVHEGATPPVIISTTTPWSVLYHRAESGGNITSDGGMPIIDKGVCWAIAPTTPDITGSHAGDNIDAIGSYDTTITGLNESATYNVCAYAVNGVGIAYGPTLQFTTPAMPPENTGTATASNGDVVIPEVALDFNFTGVAGGGGNDVTVDDLTGLPSNPGAAFLASTYTGDFSVVITNNTGFTFTNAELRFNIDELEALAGGGIDQDIFLGYANGAVTGIDIWRRADYGLGDFVFLAALLYHDANGTNGDADDYLYCNVNSFSEFAFTGDSDHTLPVTLSSFDAVVTAEGAVQLDWIAQSEVNVAGYNLYRHTEDNLDTATLLTPALIPAQNLPAQQSYRYIDSDVQQETTYSYWLEGVDLDGSSRLFGPIQVLVTPENPGGDDVPEPDMVTALQGNYPNPFNPSTTVAYSLAEEATVRLSVYNLRGRRVQVLDEGLRSAGEHRVVWDGLDTQGEQAGSGVYLFRLETGGEVHLRKGILMK
ncbi:MAG: C39 family peptidase [Candidatus Cloacimonetes bacterium]|nr:C39 family peptidase [Candidatus Cloacimonadota bacterium]